MDGHKRHRKSNSVMASLRCLLRKEELCLPYQHLSGGLNQSSPASKPSIGLGHDHTGCQGSGISTSPMPPPPTTG